MAKIITTSNISSKDFTVSLGKVRVKDGSFYIKTDDGFGGLNSFNIGDPLSGWTKPTIVKEMGSAMVQFYEGIAAFQYVSGSWVFKFFQENPSVVSIPNIRYVYKTANYTVSSLDRKIECNGTFDVTIPLLSAIIHYESIFVINSGAGLGAQPHLRCAGKYNGLFAG